MKANKKDIDEVYLALRYPNYHTWRDLEKAKANGSRWPNGEPVRLSDPEMKPAMDKLSEELRRDPEKARNFLQNLGLHKPSET